MRLGWDTSADQRAGAWGARRSRRHQAYDRSWPHPLPVLRRREPTGTRCEPSSRRFRSRSSSMATFRSTPTPRALAVSGADAGDDRTRASKGVPGFPVRSRGTSRTDRRRGAPPLKNQFNLIAALHEETLAHYGLRIGRSQARKHLGWGARLGGGERRRPAPTASIVAASAHR